MKLTQIQDHLGYLVAILPCILNFNSLQKYRGCRNWVTLSLFTNFYEMLQDTRLVAHQRNNVPVFLIMHVSEPRSTLSFSIQNTSFSVLRALSVWCTSRDKVTSIAVRLQKQTLQINTLVQCVRNNISNGCCATTHVVEKNNFLLY